MRLNEETFLNLDLAELSESLGDATNKNPLIKATSAELALFLQQTFPRRCPSRLESSDFDSQRFITIWEEVTQAIRESEEALRAITGTNWSERKHSHIWKTNAETIFTLYEPLFIELVELLETYASPNEIPDTIKTQAIWVEKILNSIYLIDIYAHGLRTINQPARPFAETINAVQKKIGDALYPKTVIPGLGYI